MTPSTALPSRAGARALMASQGRLAEALADAEAEIDLIRARIDEVWVAATDAQGLRDEVQALTEERDDWREEAEIHEAEIKDLRARLSEEAIGAAFLDSKPGRTLLEKLNNCEKRLAAYAEQESGK